MSGFSLFGVNLSGAEYDPGGTIEGTNYTYPTDAEIDYYASKGMTVIRLPFLLERVEPVAGGPLSTTELGYIDNVVNYAASKGIDVILDPHDYGSEYGAVIGTTAASNATFANFWGELAGHFASSSNVLFGLMNEPNAVTPAQWLVSANAAIAAIRAAGATSQQILVPGTDWDGAAQWVSSGNAQVLGNGIVDPSHNFAFEVHQYLDADGSGTSSTVVSTTIGVERLTAITQWAEATGNKLFLGEFGVASDATSLTAMNNMLAYMAQHTDVWEGGTYWAGGPRLSNYMYSTEPTNGVDALQMGVLQQYVPTTSLTEVGGHFNMSEAAGSDPTLEYGGVAVTAGQFGGWAPIAAEQTATGYEVAWKLAGANQYSVWTTDSSGNFISTTAVMSGTSSALEAYESSFHQDLNGDGVIGLVQTVIESNGSTSLVQAGSNFFLYGAETAPMLEQGGVAVTAGQLGGWAPIAAEQTATGYEVAWKLAGANQYSVWTTDSSGNFISTTAVMSGTSSALEAYESSFHQDLNGDGVISTVQTLIESNGSTSLVEVGNNFYLDVTSIGPMLEQGGVAVVAGQMGGWAPIAAEQTASGYEVAWKAAGADQYSVWTTDSSGNFISTTAVMSGTSSALETYETSFHQDLNGDGVIGTAETVIESNGSTTLVEVGNNFYLDGTSTGPMLEQGGVAVTAGQFGGWAPIAAEQTATGYEVAWKLAGANQYSVWTTDSSGNFISTTAVMSGTSSALEAYESSFHQDLNGDGVIGAVQTVIESNGSTSLVEAGGNFYLDGTETAPMLEQGGVAVTAGQFGGWAPIAAEQTATGYEVAWKLAGANQYSVWTTDSTGNFISTTAVMSGTSSALEAYEFSFHQDLNGDGVIGPVQTVIESNGSTSLVEAGGNFYLDGTKTAPMLEQGGVAVTAGQFGGWAPIAAEQTATGYEVAWKAAGADQYSVWTTDSSGNFISTTAVMSGTSSALEAYESSFHQDLNRDGVIGAVQTVIESNGSTSLVEAGGNFYLDGTETAPMLEQGGVAVTAGQFGGWAPIAAEQTATGYEVAWKLAGANQYSVWTTDSTGNFISTTAVMSGTSSALEAFESSFHQDLNGDGVIGLAVAASAPLELSAANSQNVTFESSTGTLKLDNPGTFTGQVVGFTGDGTIAGSDHIDLINLAFSAAVQADSTYSSSTDTLSVSNGTTLDLLSFVGNYVQANFQFASDGNGGTIVFDPPVTSNQAATAAAGNTIVAGNSIIEGSGAVNSPVVVEGGATLTLNHVTGEGAIINNGTVQVTNNSTVNLSAGMGQDNFVFAPNFGQTTISHFTPGTDTLQFDHTIFASLGALAAATHDDSRGNAVITDASHDTVTIENVTTAQLLAHQSDFHLV